MSSWRTIVVRDKLPAGVLEPMAYEGLEAADDATLGGFAAGPWRGVDFTAYGRTAGLGQALEVLREATPAPVVDVAAFKTNLVDILRAPGVGESRQDHLAIVRQGLGTSGTAGEADRGTRKRKKASAGKKKRAGKTGGKKRKRAA